MQAVEIRNYTLKPGTRAAFHRLMSEQALLALIQHYTSIVLMLDAAGVAALREE